MNGRERVKAALAHRQPDRTPIALGVTIVDCLTRFAKEDYERYMGYPVTEPTFTHFTMGAVETPASIKTRLGEDFATLRMGMPDNDKSIKNQDGSFYDETGALLVPVKYYYDCVKRPLEGDITLQDIEKTSWPDPYDKGRVRGLRQKAEAYVQSGDKAIVADICYPGPFEMALWVRGWPDFLADMQCDPELAEALLEKTTDLGIQYWDAYLSEIGDDNVDVVCHGDDLGMQDRSILSKDLYRKMLKKHHARIYGYIKSRTKAKIFHHSCGSVYELLPDLVETGIDILDSIQTPAKDMDPVRLKREFGQDISFWGAIDVQKLLPTGTPAEIDTTIKTLVETMGKDGGYVLAPSHNIQAGTPPENIEAMIEAIIKYR